MRRFWAWMLTLTLLVPATAAADGIITTRVELNNLLGGQGTTDTFETFDVADSTVVALGVSQLNASTVVLGQGPGLVHAGATYISLNAPFAWMGSDYNGLPMSKTLLASYASQALSPESPLLFRAIRISYDVPPQLVGIDLVRFGDLGIVTIELYDAAGEFVADFFPSLEAAGQPVFFGYRYSPGIGSIVVKNTKFGTVWSPNIDDHTYGMLDVTGAKATTWGRLKTLYR